MKTKVEFEDLVLKWNIENPVDRWWRSKHGIAFNSPSHREISFIDEYFEFLEDRLYRRASEKSERQRENPYVPGMHDFVIPRPVDKEMSEEDFDNIEI